MVIEIYESFWASTGVENKRWRNGKENGGSSEQTSWGWTTCQGMFKLRQQPNTKGSENPADTSGQSSSSWSS